MRTCCEDCVPCCDWCRLADEIDSHDHVYCKQDGKIKSRGGSCEYFDCEDAE